MKILITGGNGMLGHELRSVFPDPDDVEWVDIGDFDITDDTACIREITRRRPEIVVHAAAYTAVDNCEKQPELAMSVNGRGAGNVARACRQAGALMVYYSSDYIFSGDSAVPYREEDTPDPLSVYGRSKLEGERQVRDELRERHLIIRTSWLFGAHGKNFVDTIIALGRQQSEIRVVDDQTGCPTYAPDLAAVSAELLRINATGTFNVCNSGPVTWRGFAAYFMAAVAPTVRIVPITTAEYPLPAKRPAWSALSTEKLARVTGSHLPAWQAATHRYLAAKYSTVLTKESRR